MSSNRANKKYKQAYQIEASTQAKQNNQNTLSQSKQKIKDQTDLLFNEHIKNKELTSADIEKIFPDQIEHFRNAITDFYNHVKSMEKSDPVSILNQLQDYQNTNQKSLFANLIHLAKNTDNNNTRQLFIEYIHLAVKSLAYTETTLSLLNKKDIDRNKLQSITLTQINNRTILLTLHSAHKKDFYTDHFNNDEYLHNIIKVHLNYSKNKFVKVSEAYNHGNSELESLIRNSVASSEIFILNAKDAVLICDLSIHLHLLVNVSIFHSCNQTRVFLKLEPIEILTIFKAKSNECNHDTLTYRILNNLYPYLICALKIEDLVSYYTNDAITRMWSKNQVTRAPRHHFISANKRQEFQERVRAIIKKYNVTSDADLIKEAIRKIIETKASQSIFDGESTITNHISIYLLIANTALHELSSFFLDFPFVYLDKLNEITKLYAVNGNISQFINDNDLMSIVTSPEWNFYSQTLPDILQLLKNSHESLNYFKFIIKITNSIPDIGQTRDEQLRLDLTDEDFTSSIKYITNNIAIMSKVNECIDEHKKELQKNQDAFLKELLDKKQNETAYIRYIASKHVPHATTRIETVKAEIVTDKPAQPSTLDLAVEAFQNKEFERALSLYEACKPKDKFCKNNAIAYIEALWAMADCYQALSAGSYGKNQKLCVENARKLYNQAYSYIKDAIKLFNNDEVIKQKLSIYINFIESDLGIDNNHQEAKRASQYRFDDVTVTTQNNKTYQSNPNDKWHKHDIIVKNDSSVEEKISGEKVSETFIPDSAVRELATNLSLYNIYFYLYGGAVLDILLNRKPRDYDFCVGDSIANFEKILKKLNYNNYNIFKNANNTICILQLNLNNTVIEFNCVASAKQFEYDPEAFKRGSDASINAIRYYPATSILRYLPSSKKDIKNKIIAMHATESVKLRFQADPCLHFRFINLASKLKLTFELHSTIKNEINEFYKRINLFDDGKRRKCYSIFSRGLLNGNAETTWDLYQQHSILMPRSNEFAALITESCKKADADYHKARTPNLAALSTIFLLEPVLQAIQSLSENDLTTENIEQCINKVVSSSDFGLPYQAMLNKIVNIFYLYLELGNHDANFVKFNYPDEITADEFMLANQLLELHKPMIVLRHDYKM